MKKSIKTLLVGVLFVPMLVLGISLLSPITASAHTDIVKAGDIVEGTTSTLYTDATAKTHNDAVAAAAAAENTPGAGAKIAKPTGAPDDLGKMFTQIANVALYIIGAVSVLMLIYGGIRYTVSAGDSTAVTAAKSTIMYAVIGVVVALLAYAIVNFVLVSVTGTPVAS